MCQGIFYGYFYLDLPAFVLAKVVILLAGGFSRTARQVRFAGVPSRHFVRFSEQNQRKPLNSMNLFSAEKRSFRRLASSLRKTILLVTGGTGFSLWSSRYTAVEAPVMTITLPLEPQEEARVIALAQAKGLQRKP